MESLDDGVGRQGRAVDDDAEIAGLHPRELQDVGDSGQHAFLRRARRGQHFHAGTLAVPVEAEVGERAADVDADAERTCGQASLPTFGYSS
jgi:hypothetical protein